MPSVHVLLLEHDCIYVGSTTRTVTERFAEHASRDNTCAWTKAHRPLRVLREMAVPAHDRHARELVTTAEWVRSAGLDRVRGAHFARVDPSPCEKLAMTAVVAFLLDDAYETTQRELLAPVKGVVFESDDEGGE